MGVIANRLKQRRNELIGKDANRASPISRFTEGRQDLKMRMRNLTFKRKRSYERKQNWTQG